MKTAIIGSGNMGGSIAHALATHPEAGASSLTCTARTKKTLEKLSAETPGINTTTDNREAVGGADLVIFAVKPWILPDVAAEVRDLLSVSCPVVVSVAAGVSLDDLEAMLYAEGGTDRNIAIFRVIPNTAISVGKGMTFISSRHASALQQEQVSRLFEAMGSVMQVSEDKIAAGTALASCGIAYALRYVRAATEGGVQLGFKAEDAQEIVCKTVEGAVALLEANGTHPEEEIDRVTTPGGITIKGLNEMERKGFTAAVVDGLLASK